MYVYSRMKLVALQKYLFRFSWFWIAVGCLFLFFTTSVYLSFRDDIHFLLAKQDLVGDWVWRTAFYIHVSSGMLCIALGPFQFLPALRKHRMGLHRLMGKVYVGAILIFSAPTGLYMAFFANGGFWAAAGFFMLSLVWFFFSYLAIYYIKKGNVQKHRQFMAYSFALTFSAVTLRLWVPILSNYMGVDHDLTVVLTAWINWIPNLLVAHILVKLFPEKL